MGVAGAQDPGVLQAIVYNRGSLKLLDQRELPVVTRYIDVPDSTAGWQAIKEMVVRGAPAIAIAASLSLAAEVSNLKSLPESQEDALAFLKDRLEFLVSSRPTAVNLHEAKEKLYRLASQAAAQSSEVKDTIMAYVEAAEAMLAADIEANKAIGKYGAHYILNNQDKEKKLSVLTHCNTGSLATAGYGTALGVIRALHAMGKLDTAYCTETRPYNQGSRLTAFELVHDKIPSVLIADSAAAALQQSGRVDAVVVGADRIAANGDTANKIGTYSLALSAFAHKIPFYVAAPLTSIDTGIISGQDIVIEERSPSELTHTHGGHGSQVAASGISAWNPAFDVTAAKYITAIITDKGVIEKEPGSSKFDIPSFIKEIERKAIKENDEIKDCQKINEVGFYHLTEGTLASYIKALPEIAERLGEPANEWKIEEVGDGNLNYVYIVTGPKGSFVLKQAIPYVRCVGESWPMTIERAFFEASALKVHGSYSPEHVPEVYYFDVKMATIIMQYLEPPHIILRKGLISGVQYPSLAEHVSDYLANTLFSTSLLAHTTEEHKLSVKIFLGNVEMCRLTEQVIFTDPYMIASNNRWTSPQLDEDVKILREDDEIKVEIAGLKAKFCERSQALIHGDLHTGSIMVTSTSTKVIDPEFAFYGPMGFDIGAFLGNLFLAFYAQNGHASNNDDRKDYKIWILKAVAETWTLFTKKFILLWDNSFKMLGDAYPKEVYNSANVRKLSQLTYLNDLFEDALGYAAAKMIRRIVGIAHVEDFESIKDTNIRAYCERRALHFAKSLLKRRYKIGTIEEVINMAVSFES